ncbi:MAG: malto-oligosyltrehalose trehalohydrolase [Acidobacteriaceae bacterium]|nr:malto-oligosyltrehalose trehalohydrolase [Acidobacteriaceae bacterium]
MSSIYLTPTRSAVPGAAFIREENGTYFRVWAPGKKTINVVFEDGRTPAQLNGEPTGYFEAFIPGAVPGDLYKYQVDGGEAYPDPASRFQPKGPHGHSQIIDSQSFPWADKDWPGLQLKGQVLYEMHIGTFTPGGTWAAAAEKLEYLRDTGITVLEVMPIADFPGRFGWGYDGVQPYAPVSIYGTPDNLRSFVDRAHALGIGIILDVVYNHLGPDGNYLTKYSPYYLSEKHTTDWGQGINFDGENSGPVREFFRENAAYWIREFHLDGLRFDATQDIHDDSEPNILREIGEAAREAAGNRSIILIGENEPQDTRLLRPIEQDGYGFDALWNDDYHHTATVALTGKADAYYTDYRGTPQEFVSTAKYGYLFQGQWYRWQKQRRGTSMLGLPRPAMINFIQNHDQIANSARGQRTHELSSPGAYKAVTALTLLMPGTPMLFQGQEFESSSRFLFFADHQPELAEKIRAGRAEFLGQWRSLVLPEMKKCFDDPASPQTFERSKLDFSEVTKHAEAYALHRDLLRLRRADPVIGLQGEHGIDGAVLSHDCFVLRFFSQNFENDRLLLVNLGVDLDLNPAPEPLLAPPFASLWVKLWSSDDPQYGGCGTAVLDSKENWKIPGQAAVVLHPIAIK